MISLVGNIKPRFDACGMQVMLTMPDQTVKANTMSDEMKMIVMSVFMT